MRNGWICFYLAVVVVVGVAFGAVGCSSSRSNGTEVDKTPGTNTAGAPQLLRVSVYMSGLSTGWIGIELPNNELRAFTRWPIDTAGLSPGEARKYKDNRGVTVISAKITKQEVDTLTKLVKQSNLRGFKPEPGHINERMPNMDECPPSLVLTWPDGEEVFHLPLRGTVKSTTSQDVQQRYAGMDRLVDYIMELENKYRVPLTAKSVPYETLKKSPEYQQYEKDRDRLFWN